MNNNKQIYNRQHAILSDWYKYGVGHTYKRYFINKIIKYIKNIDDISSILDLGCGEGSNTYFISTKFNTDKVVGIDITEEGVKKAKLNFPNIDFLQLNLDEIELSNMQQYDLVCSFDVLEHVDDWENLLHKMTVICNKYILITVPTGRMRDYEVSIGHLRNFKKGEIENFLNNNNFRTIKTFYGGFPFYSPLGRDYLNKNHKNYEESITGDFTNKQKIFHKMLYILFRYFCFDNIGDMFTGLFIKDDITINSNGGGGKL